MKLILQKMDSKLESIIQYSLRTSIDSIAMNDLIGKEISLNWSGTIYCSKCSKVTKKSFGEGFCFTCFSSAAEASPCILHPELCEAHLGKGRDLEFEERNHNQPHFVYLAATDKVKVGVTRATQIPTRWIDQGASSSIILAETPNRYLAGCIEVALKDFFTDKTNWQNMLRNFQDESIDLEEEKWQVHEELPSDLTQYWVENDEIIQLNYPVLEYPEKVSSMSFDKTAQIQGKLTGIRGQYLIFDNKNVINIRRHTGYEIEINEVS
ncbi:MAG: DUF2797 domain-containing protein [Flavobacteriales bacterium]|nr:DUF2797 domain-containing protein [Flavobacteriales bacterium]